MIRYVGIDLHKRLLVVCILDERGQVEQELRIDEVTQASILAFARIWLRPTDHVVLEVTTNTWPVYRLLLPFVARVVVSNPVATKAIAQAKVKTDKVDAHVLAQLLRLDFLPTVWAPDEALSQLRELTARRTRLVEDRTKLVNRIRTCLAMRLLDCPHSIPDAKGRAWLAAVQLDEDGRALVDSDLRLLTVLEDEIAALEKRLAQRVYQDDRVRLLMTLPGVSQNVAQAVVAAAGDITRFPTPEKFAGYLGLVPSTRQSAKSCHHGPITKAGRVQARTALIQAAHCVRSDLGPLGHFFNKVARRKSYNVAVTAVARKLAMLAWHLLTTLRPYRYARPACPKARTLGRCGLPRSKVCDGRPD
jgi:transposase